MAAANGKSIRVIEWKQFIDLCILEELITAGRVTPAELLERLDMDRARERLARYGLVLGEVKEVFSPKEVFDAVNDLSRTGKVSHFDDRIAITPDGILTIPDIR